VTIAGEWALYFDWGCTGTYYPTSICFNNDGTFSHTADTESRPWGKWVQVDGMILWQFKLSTGLKGYCATSYSGNKLGNVMVGLMIYGNPNRIYRGRWYAIKTGTKLYNLKKDKPGFDITGKKINTKK
jgi:hypothetical protein